MQDKKVTHAVQVPESLRQAFVQVCKGQDRSAAQVTRELMRDYIKKNGQRELFYETSQ